MQSKKEGKDQESIQKCTTPDPGHCKTNNENYQIPYAWAKYVIKIAF